MVPINLIHGYEKLSEIGFKITFCDEYFMYKSLRSSHLFWKNEFKRRLSLHDTMKMMILLWDASHKIFEPKKLNFGIIYKQWRNGFFANYFYQIISNGEYFNLKPKKEKKKPTLPIQCRNFKIRVWYFKKIYKMFLNLNSLKLIKIFWVKKKIAKKKLSFR